MAKSGAVEIARKPWERTESKVVRPFKSASEYLHDVTLRLYAEDEFVLGPSIHVETVDRDRLGLALKLSPPPKDFDDMVGIPLDDLRLIIAIEDRTVKHSSVVRSLTLAELKDGLIDLRDEATAVATWTGETRVHLAVVLSKQRKVVVGLPYRAGSWVARKTFSIARLRDTAAFNIQPVDESWFVARGLPPTTTYFVEILDSDLNQPCEQLPQLVQVYISKSLNAALARDDDSPTTRALVRSIYVDIVSSVLTVGYLNLKGSADENSVLSVVTARLSKSTGLSDTKIAECARENNGTRLRAVVQAESELTKNMIAATARRAA